MRTRSGLPMGSSVSPRYCERGGRGRRICTCRSSLALALGQPVGGRSRQRACGVVRRGTPTGRRASSMSISPRACWVRTARRIPGCTPRTGCTSTRQATPDGHRPCDERCSRCWPTRRRGCREGRRVLPRAGLSPALHRIRDTLPYRTVGSHSSRIVLEPDATDGSPIVASRRARLQPVREDRLPATGPSTAGGSVRAEYTAHS